MKYIITFGAVTIGYLIALLLKPKNNKQVKLLLAFSGAFLLSLTVLHLLPELFEDTHHHHEHTDECEHDNLFPIGFFIMIGILLQIVLEFFSKGAEHGHVHQSKDNNHNHEFETMPWLLFVSLCIHALLEGFPINKNPDLAYGIGIHHLPIAIILTLFFIKSGLSKINIFIFMMGFALMTPIGTFMADYFVFFEDYYKQITAIVVGILFHIASTIIFESNEGHKFNLAKLIAIIIGFGLAFLLESGHHHG